MCVSVIRGEWVYYVHMSVPQPNTHPLLAAEECERPMRTLERFQQSHMVLTLAETTVSLAHTALRWNKCLWTQSGVVAAHIEGWAHRRGGMCISFGSDGFMSNKWCHVCFAAGAGCHSDADMLQSQSVPCLWKLCAGVDVDLETFLTLGQEWRKSKRKGRPYYWCLDTGSEASESIQCVLFFFKSMIDPLTIFIAHIF